jgi:hypothetical protein
VHGGQRPHAVRAVPQETHCGRAVFLFFFPPWNLYRVQSENVSIYVRIALQHHILLLFL